MFHQRVSGMRLALLLCVALALLVGPAGPASLMPSHAHAQSESTPAWSIAWTISGSGFVEEGSVSRGDYHSIRRNISVTGAATVREGSDGFMVTRPFQLTVHDDREERTQVGDLWRIERHTITNPTKYTGGPDEYWVFPTDFSPQRGADGTWGLPSWLFSTGFFVNGDLARNFTYRVDVFNTHEGWDEPIYQDQLPYSIVLLNQTTNPARFDVLPGNADGSAFELDTTYTSGEEIVTPLQLKVNFHASVHGLNDCLTRPAPIDATDPVLKGQQLDLKLSADKTEIRPDGTATVTAALTCQGVPVKNAQLTLGALAFGGGHTHNDGRPYGYLAGVKVNPADYQHTLTRATDAQGLTSFSFQPGKDTKNEQIGIAGQYIVRAEAAAFDATARLDMVVRVPNLQRLPLGNPMLQVEPNSRTDTHPANDYATADTIEALKTLAPRYMDMQRSFNTARQQRGEPVWPILPLYVNDISLPWGGLFDVTGWDNQAGGVRGAAWQPPHYTHTDGSVVDFSLNDPVDLFFAPEQRGAAHDLLRAILRILGRPYGTWAPGPTLTLAVRQSAPATTRTLASGADPGVVALVSGSGGERNPVAAPGQTVGLVFAVDNTNGAAEASQVALTATLPSGLSFQSASVAPSSISGQQLTWQFGSLPAQALPRLITVQAQVSPSAAPGTTLSASAEVTSAADASAANNQDAASIIVRAPGADLLVAAHVQGGAQTIETPALLSIEVSNNGTDAAQAATATLTLPSGVNVESASDGFSRSGQNVSWSLNTISPNETRTLTAALSLDPSFSLPATFETNAPTVSYTVQAAASNEQMPADNQQTLTVPVAHGGSDVRVGLAVPGGNATGATAPGQILTYQIAYGNSGTAIAATTAITLSLDSGMELVDAQPAAASTSTSASFPGGIARWNVGDLAPGADGVIVAHVRIKSLPQVGSLAQVQAESVSQDAQPANNTAFDLRYPAASAPGGTSRFVVYVPLARR